MNVLMLTSEFYPTWGGIGSYVSELVHHIPDDVTMHVLTPNRPQLGKVKFNGDEAPDGLPDNVHVHHIGKARDTFWHYFYFQLACRKSVPALVKKHGIDLIHSQNTMPDLFISPKSLQIPIITTIHTTIEGQIKAVRDCKRSVFSLEPSERMTLLLGRFFRFLEDRYYTEDRYFITVSEWARNKVTEEKNIDPDKISVIYNGITADKFSSVTKEEAEQHFSDSVLTDNDAPKVLYFSRLIDKKGIAFLMEAIPKILDQCDAHFIFAGAGRKIELDIPSEHYTFLGYIDEREKPYLYALADIFVLPSLYENCPISILEAMASEKAIITTTVGGIPELIKHQEEGLLIQPRSSLGITNAVLTLVENDRLREQLGVNAKRTVKRRFTSENVVAQTVGYYNKVLAGHQAKTLADHKAPLSLQTKTVITQ